jgi:uncharacterized protein
MLIDFRELLSGSQEDISYEAHIDMNEFDLGYISYPIEEKSSFVINAHKSGKKKVNIVCSGTVVLSIPCDRCLTPVRTAVGFDVDEWLEFDAKTGSEDEEEKDYIDGYNLDVDRLIFGELLISLPAKVLCSDDCRGLCPVCGNNLNVSECGCDKTVPDPRMSVFKDILNNFKEV